MPRRLPFEQEAHAAEAALDRADGRDRADRVEGLRRDVLGRPGAGPRRRRGGRESFMAASIARRVPGRPAEIGNGHAGQEDRVAHRNDRKIQGFGHRICHLSSAGDDSTPRPRSKPLPITSRLSGGIRRASRPPGGRLRSPSRHRARSADSRGERRDSRIAAVVRSAAMEYADVLGAVGETGGAPRPAAFVRSPIGSPGRWGVSSAGLELRREACPLRLIEVDERRRAFMRLF